MMYEISFSEDWKEWATWEYRPITYRMFERAHISNERHYNIASFADDRLCYVRVKIIDYAAEYLRRFAENHARTRSDEYRAVKSLCVGYPC